MKYLLIILCLTSALLAEKSLYVSDNYIYKPTSCEYSCEDVKDGYFSRISNINPENGLTTCNIYSVSNPLAILETRTTYNKYCKEEFTYITDKSEDAGSKLSIDNQLKALETKYFHNYINVGNTQFLTAPEYLVAVLTADADIINISETIEENRIILNSGYTIYPNENKQYEANFIQKIFNFFSELNPFAEDKNTIIPIENYPTNLKSSTSQLISTIGVFWLDFLTESNYLYQETNFLIVILIAPFSFIILLGENYTQQLSKVASSNNYVGEGIVSIFVCLTMFVSYTTAKTGETDFSGKEKNLDQSFYQDNASSLIGNGVKIANSFNASFNKVYINQMARNASINPSLTQMERLDKLDYLQKVYSEYDKYLNECSQLYNIDTLKNIVSNVYNLPLTYPPNEIYGNINFYTQLNNSNDLIKHNLYSISSCYQVNRQKQVYAMKIQSLAKEIEYSKEAYENGMEDRVLNIAEVAYKNTVEMGFLSALTTTSMNSILSNMEEWQHYSDDIDKKREYIEEETQKTMKTYSQIDSSDFLENDLVSMFPKYIPYFVMPFFTDIYYGVGRMADFGGNIATNALKNNQPKSTSKSKSLNSALGMKTKKSEGYISLVANFVLKIAKQIPAFSFLESLLSIGTQAMILAVSIWIYEYFLQLLVPFAILSAGLLVVLFWMAEIVIYYLVVPFMFAYVMLKGQGNAISKFLARGLIIASRPTLIVFSIIIAILLHSLYEAVSVFIITKNFSAIFGLNELGMIDTFTGLIQQGFFEIALKLIIPVLMFFVIMIGSTMFLKQFGYSDEAEFGQQLQRSMENKGGRYSLPV